MKRLKSGQLVLGLGLLTLLGSCVVTKAEGEQMSSDIARLRNEIAALQRDRSDFAIIVEKKNNELQNRVGQLENVTFKKATSESLESDRLKKEVEQLRDQLEQTQKNVETIKDKPIVNTPVELENIPSDKKGHFDWSQKAFADGNYSVALLRIDSFIEKYRDDNQYGAQAYVLKGDAAVLLAKKAPTEAARKDFYKKAVTAYQDLLTRFPKSPRIPEGLFKVGETLEAMAFPADAKIFYEEITSKHPKSAFAKQAHAKLTRLTVKKKK